MLLLIGDSACGRALVRRDCAPFLLLLLLLLLCCGERNGIQWHCSCNRRVM